MDKKDKNDTSAKDKKPKRLKTHHGKQVALSPANVDCYCLEEQESAEGTYEFFIETCQRVHNYTHSLVHARKGKENQPSKMQGRLDTCVLTMQLKKLNRLDKHMWKKTKDMTNERKQIVDAANLKYQNLLYEVTHLEKEVMKCVEFRSLDEDIDLVPIEMFYRDAPEEISKPNVTKVNQHEQTIARLCWELEQRKKLEIDIKNAELLKQSLTKEIKDLEVKLSSIFPILKAIIAAAEPFASKLGMPFQAAQLKFDVAKYLPRPLYVLYAQVCAYQTHCEGDWLKINIEGAIDDAKALQATAEELYDDSGDSDPEEKETREMSSRRQSSSEKKQAKKIDILVCHPMSVVVTIDKDLRVDLQFCYLSYLRIVTVKVRSLMPEPMSTDLIGDLLRPDTILHCLTPKDTGDVSPNLSNAHLLNSKFKEQFFSNETTGWPYIWAQKLAGLDFLSMPSQDNSHMYFEIPKNVKRIISAINNRLSSRNHLYQQITSLDLKLKVPENFMALYPQNVPSEIRIWKPISWNEIKNDNRLLEFCEIEIADKHSLYYRAEIQRSSAILSSLVVIPPNYPAQTPIFMINLNWGGEQTGTSNFIMKELEEEVNVHLVNSLTSDHKPYTLACQLYHLLVCLDVFLEVECYGDNRAGPLEFSKEKVIVRYFRGKGRSRPYKCTSAHGIFSFR